MARRTKPRKSFPESPTCNCALLCDDVVVSQGRGKHTLQGVINGIMVQDLPGTVGPFVAYVRVSNVYGVQEVHVGLEPAGHGAPVFEFVAQLPERADPLGVYTLVVAVPPCRIERPGRYLFSVKSGTVPLAESPILVRVLES